ncbi:armadillo-type protein [Mycena latifolia]|nr:armadillo-type protein [Mycena latifolia]
MLFGLLGEFSESLPSEDSKCAEINATVDISLWTSQLNNNLLCLEPSMSNVFQYLRTGGFAIVSFALPGAGMVRDIGHIRNLNESQRVSPRFLTHQSRVIHHPRQKCMRIKPRSPPSTNLPPSRLASLRMRWPCASNSKPLVPESSVSNARQSDSARIKRASPVTPPGGAFLRIVRFLSGQDDLGLPLELCDVKAPTAPRRRVFALISVDRGSHIFLGVPLWILTDHETPTLFPLSSAPTMHHPLTRQRTRGSLYSWWSDRNPPGPTIDLHAIAKPLMRFMYRRDVLAFITKNRGAPLSQEAMDIYSSYLAYKYISSSTKAAILVELERRLDSDDDARAVAESFLLHLADEFLRSSHIEICKSMCRILRLLAHRETIIPAVLRWTPCQQLVSLLSAMDIGVIMVAAETLSSIAKCAEGAQAVVDAKVFDCFAELLKSPNEKVQKWLREIMGELIRHDITARAATGAMASLLRSEDPKIVENAARILFQSTDSFGSAQAIMDTNVLQCVPDLLQSRETGVRKWTWSLLDESARHELTTRAAVEQVVSLIRGDDVRLVRGAAHRLWQTSKSSAGAQAAVDAHVLEYLPALVEFPDAWIQQWAWNLLEELVHHESTASAGTCELISLCRIPTVTKRAIHMLDHILTSPHVAQTLSNTALDVWDAEKARRPAVNDEACPGEAGIPPAVSPYVFLSGAGADVDTSLGNLDVVFGAAKALNWIVESPEGANAALDANVLECFSVLLELPHARVWIRTWDIVKTLAHHETTRPPLALSLQWIPIFLKYLAELFESAAAFVREWAWDTVETLLRHQPATEPIAQYIVSLFRGGRLTKTNLKHAAHILDDIISAPQGDKALMDIDTYGCVAVLLQLPNNTSPTWDWMWRKLRKIASEQPTTEVVVDQLVLLLRHDNSDVVVGASKVLDSIATSSEDAQAVVDAHLLDCAVTSSASLERGTLERAKCSIQDRAARVP